MRIEDYEVGYEGAAMQMTANTVGETSLPLGSIPMNSLPLNAHPQNARALGQISETLGHGAIPITPQANSISREQLIISRASVLLELLCRNTRRATHEKPLLAWKRLGILGNVIRRLSQQRRDQAPAGTVFSRSAIRLAETIPYTPLQLYVLALFPTNPTDCSRLLEAVLVKLNTEAVRLCPESMVDHLPEASL